MELKKTICVKVLITDILFWCLLCVFVVMGFLIYDGVRQYASVSLRYDTPISGEAAYAARRYSAAHNNVYMFRLTFWDEYKAVFSNEFVSAEIVCIAYSGDALLVWPAKFIKGAAPGVIDGIGCAVSEGLAWRLWGSTDIVGMTVDVDGAEYVVRGVFMGKDELALLSFRDEDTSRSWSAVELDGSPAKTTRDEVESYAAASGLGRPVFILTDSPVFLTGLMAVLPLFILAVFGFVLIAGYVGKRFPIACRFIPFLLFPVLAALLPVLLGFLPEWMIPTRWSDFSFWGSLVTQASDNAHEFLRAVPQSRDVELRILILKQSGTMFLSVCLSIVICFRRKQLWRGSF